MFFSKKVLGLDIGTSSIKIVELDVSRNKAVLQRVGYTTLPTNAVVGGEIQDTVAVSEAISRLIQEGNFKRKSAAVGMFGTSVITKKISMPKMDKNLISEQIRWEAEQYIPIDLDKVTLDYHVLSNRVNGDTQEVLLIAGKHEHIYKYMEALSLSQLKTAVLDVSAFALANIFEFNYGRSNDVVALINIGSGVTHFVVVERGEVVFARDIPMGGTAYSNEIQKEMGVSFEEAEALKISASQGQGAPTEVQNAIQAINEVFAEEISTSFQIYGSASNGQSISRFFLSGGSSLTIGIKESISHSTGTAAEILNPFIRISCNPKNFSPEYIRQITPFVSVALGLGLRAEKDS